jgi:hypothetical protein
MTNTTVRSVPILVLGLALPVIATWGGGCDRGVLSSVDGSAVGPAVGLGIDGGVGGGSGCASQATPTCELTIAQGSAGGQGGSDGGALPPPDGRKCPCSRRPGETQTVWCPPGSGARATLVIGPDGGTITLGKTPATVGVPFSLEIPPNALQECVAIEVTETMLAPPVPFVDGSPVYDIQPAGLALAVPATLTIPMTNNGGDILAFSLYQSFTCGATFSRILDSVYEGGFLVGSMSTLGAAFTGYPRGPADDQACASAPDSGTP